MTITLSVPSGAQIRESSVPVRALAVDDDPDQRQLLGIWLRRAGCTVFTAGSAEEALAIIDMVPLDLAVLDLNLPGMNGERLASVLRSRQPLCKIVLTSVLDPATFPAADAILPKPFTRVEVLRLVPGWRPNIPHQRRGDHDR